MKPMFEFLIWGVVVFLMCGCSFMIGKAAGEDIGSAQLKAAHSKGWSGGIEYAEDLYADAIRLNKDLCRRAYENAVGEPWHQPKESAVNDMFKADNEPPKKPVEKKEKKK